MTNLPQELIDNVVDHLYNDKKSLQSCSLTARTFHHPSYRALFRSVKVQFGTFHDRKVKEFSDLLASPSFMAEYIQELEFSDATGSCIPTTISLSYELMKTLAHLPNIQSLTLAGFGWSYPEKYFASTNPRISLRKLSLRHFTIICSDVYSQFEQLLHFCTMFGTIGEFSVDQIWSSMGRLHGTITYDTIRQWVDEALQANPTFLKRFQVVSLHIGAEHAEHETPIHRWNFESNRPDFVNVKPSWSSFRIHHPLKHSFFTLRQWLLLQLHEPSSRIPVNLSPH
ncbi:hypothetical protein ABKN59_011172 [Abortiporus biennis]